MKTILINVIMIPLVIAISVTSCAGGTKTSEPPEVSETLVEDGLIATITPSEVGQATSTVAPLSTDTPSPIPFVMPSGQIAFVSNRADGHHVYLLDLDDPDSVNQLTTAGEINENPAWSPDGRELVLESNFNDGSVVCTQNLDCLHKIYILNLEDNAMIAVTDRYDYEAQPSWSTEINEIAYMVADLTWDLYLVDLQTGQHERLTDEESYIYYPIWSPDANFIAFLKLFGYDEENEREVFTLGILDLSARQIEYITDSRVVLSSIDWSPDGNWIAYTGLDCKLQRLNLRDGSTEVLTSGPGCDSSPSFSPDGEYLMFASNRDTTDLSQSRRRDLYLLQIDGLVVRAITQDPDPVDNYSPDWSPNR